MACAAASPAVRAAGRGLPSRPAASDQMVSRVSVGDSAIEHRPRHVEPDDVGPPRRHHQAHRGGRTQRLEGVAGGLRETIDRQRHQPFIGGLDHHRPAGLKLRDAALNGDVVSRSEQAEASMLVFQLH